MCVCVCLFVCLCVFVCVFVCVCVCVRVYDYIDFVSKVSHQKDEESYVVALKIFSE